MYVKFWYTDIFSKIPADIEIMLQIVSILNTNVLSDIGVAVISTSLHGVLRKNCSSSEGLELLYNEKCLVKINLFDDYNHLRTFKRS